VNLRLHLAERRELSRAIRWYEGQQPMLGEDLADAVKRAFVEIESAPERWPVWKRDHRARRYLLERFPFAIIYVVRNGIPFVVAVAHTQRRPRSWMKRIAGAPKPGV
jgi:toxin ParE1/3/4